MIRTSPGASTSASPPEFRSGAGGACGAGRYPFLSSRIMTPSLTFLMFQEHIWDYPPSPVSFLLDCMFYRSAALMLHLEAKGTNFVMFYRLL